ncbi:MAG: ROK family protein [Propionibacteriales bacterium]|nr:ROK family protein [Propionibacteriales bacterium]
MQTLADPSGAVLAFDVGGTTIKAEVLGPDLQTWARASVPTPHGPALADGVVDTARALLDGLTSEQRDAVRSVGLALPGIVDTARGVSIFAANLDLRDVALAEPIAARLGLPVRLGHDVACAAAAERHSGAAAGVTDPVVVVIGTGIAAVSYVHGRRVAGVTGQAGELGHVVVRPGGPRCGCGARGCLEAVASASSIARAYRSASGNDVAGAADVVARLGQDAVADAVWAEATTALADGLLIATALLAPGAIVLGGGLAEAGASLVDPVAASMRERATAVTVPPLLTAAHGSRAGVVGAALIASAPSAECDELARHAGVSPPARHTHRDGG